MALTSDVDAIDLEVAPGELTDQDRQAIRDAIAAVPMNDREQMSRVAARLLAERRSADEKSTHERD